MGKEMATVMATQRGWHHDRIYEPGDVFDVPRDLLTAKKDEKGHVVPPSWFAEVDEEEVVTKKFVARKPQAPAPADDLE